MRIADLNRLSTKFLIGDGCWDWTASKDTGGYGQFQIDGRLQGAHRVVYELLEKPIPTGLVLDHLCRNPQCVRPDHLEPVTNKENVQRGISRGSKITHCPEGHPYDDTNTYITPLGKRDCRTCRSEASRRSRLRKQGVSH